MNADRFYDSPYDDRDTDAREKAYASCVDDAETTTRDAIVSILTTVAAHVKAGKGVQLPHQRELLTETAVDDAARHLDTLDGLLAHHGFDGSIEAHLTDRTHLFVTVLAEAVQAYTVQIVGAVEEQADQAEWEPTTRPLLRRTA